MIRYEHKHSLTKWASAICQGNYNKSFLLSFSRDDLKGVNAYGNNKKNFWDWQITEFIAFQMVKDS